MSRSEHEEQRAADSVDPRGGAADPIEEGLVGPRDAPGPAPEAAPARALLTSDNRFRTGRLAGKTMNAAILALGVPVLLESMLNSLVGVTDTVLAAELGLDEADAIGGASYIVWFIGLVVMALGIGATALISRAIGGARVATANAVLSQSLILAIVAGLGTGLAIALLAGDVASLLNLSPDAARAFRTYMYFLAGGVPVSGVLFVMTACARGAGDSTRPLYAMAARNVVNIVASWALSGVDLTRAAVGPGGERISSVWLENPFSFDLGIAGIALGTVLGDAVGAAIVLGMGASGVWGIRFKKRRLRPHWVTMVRLIRLGVPNFLETLGMWIGNFFVIMFVGWLTIAAAADGLLGAHIVAIRIESLSFLPGFAIGSAAATLAGQYLGAKRPDLARTAVWRCALLAGLVMGSLGALFILQSEWVTSLLTRQPEHLELTPTLLIICGAVQIPFALGIVFRQALRGAGDVKWAMALTWFSTYGVRLPLAYLLSGVDIPLPGDGVLENPMPDDFPASGLVGLWVALCADLAIRGTLFTARFIHGGWTSKRV